MLSIHQAIIQDIWSQNYISFLSTYPKVHVFGIFLSLDLNRSSSVLFEFKDILFAFNRSVKDFRSQLISMFFKELLVYSIFLSSTK